MKEKKKGVIITLPEDVRIDMGDREVLLEKGDRVAVVESLTTNNKVFGAIDELINTVPNRPKLAGNTLALIIKSLTNEQGAEYEKEFLEAFLKQISRDISR